MTASKILQKENHLCERIVLKILFKNTATLLIIETLATFVTHVPELIDGELVFKIKCLSAALKCCVVRFFTGEMV